MSDADRCARCGGDWECQCEDDQQAAELDQQAAALALEDDWEPCDHSCDEDCYDDYDDWDCHHQHCFNCGECGCPGYCDDHVTYNLRPEETGGADGPLQAAD